MQREIPSTAGFFTNAEPSKLPPDMKAGLTGVKPMLVSLGVLLLGFLFLLPERCAVNMAFLRQDTPAPAELRERVELAPGFSIAVYASDLPGVRLLRFAEAGDLLASLPEAGSIALLERDQNGNGGPDGRRELVGRLERPHGIDVYVGETGAIGRVRFDAVTGQAANPYRRVIEDLPAGGHWSRSVRFGPDVLCTWRWARAATSASRTLEFMYRRHRTSPVIAKILAHLGLSARAPPRSPARAFNRFQLA